MLSKVLSILVLSCVILLAWSAPVKKENKEKSLADKGSSVEVKSVDVADELQKLKNAAPTATKQALNLVKTVSKSEQVVNGQKETTSNEETKVLKPGTNKVVADIKVTSHGQQNGNEAPKVETEVDIPDQGIAQKFEGYEDDEVPARNPMAFTPKAVAEYLLVSGDLEGFFSALEELVAAKVMTVEEAKSYEMEVEREYQMLLMELEQPEDMDYYNNLNFNRDDKRSDIEENDEGLFNIDTMARRADLQEALQKEEAYAELAQALVNDYIKEKEEEEEEEEAPYVNDIEGMDSDEVDNVIGLLADALVADELEKETENAIAQPEIPQEVGDSEEAELDQIAQSMGAAQEVPENTEATEAEMAQEAEEKKSRTSEEAKEIDDKKEKKSDDETIPAKKSE